MAYRTILSSETAPNAPVTSTLMIALADNLLAAFAAEAGAPRLALGSLPRLVAGSDVRFEDTSTSSASVGLSATPNSIGILQGGEIRVSFENRVLGGGTLTSTGYVSRIRAGTIATFATNVENSGSWSTSTADITVLPGDLITFNHSLSSYTSFPDASEMRNRRILTDAVDLFPVSGAFGYITGNDALT